MAEGKFAKSLTKHAGRAKEKLLQNLGKVDRTADEIFDEHINNYNRQQNNANKLQKEFNNYIRCIRAVQAASKTLMEAICEVYESQWSGSEALNAHVASVEVLWQDYSHKLGDQVLIPLNTYTAQFPEMRKKIDKRNRKLIDYDGQRHSFQNVQANAAKRKDDVKITKGRDQLEEARRTYELLNSELHDELPALHDSRILFLVTNLQTLFASEQLFHNETSKVYDELEAIVDKLATDSQRGSYSIKKMANTNSNPSSPPQSPIKSMNNSVAPVINTYPNTNGNSNNADSPSSLASSPSPVEQSLEHEQTLSSSSSSSPQQLLQQQIEQNGVSNNIDNEPSYQNTTDIFSTKMLTTQQSIIGTSGTSPIVTSTTTTNIAETTIPSSPFNDDDDDHNNLHDDDLNNTNANITTITSASSTTTTTAATTINNQIVTNELNKMNNDNRVSTTIENVNGNINKKMDNISLSPIIGVSVGGKKGINVGGGGGVEIEVGGGLGNNNRMEQLYDIPVGATTTDLPPGVLYRVKATYRYIKEDADELSFEVGETIKVIEYDDPEDQEEGWLMGMKENSTEKGLFPANFTRPL